MLNRLKKNNEGFTIIEVMIVLAIAGLIILIVLLAVPALQRNGRNTAIKNDATAVTGAIATFESDNDGAKVTAIDSTGLVKGASGSTTQAKLQGSTTVTVVGSNPAAVVPAGTIQVVLGHDCAGNPSTRANAVWYSVETSSTASVASNNKCIDS